MIQVGINLWNDEAPSTNAHFVPKNIQAPILTIDGDILTVTNGLWVANPAITDFDYTWFRTDGMTDTEIGTNQNTYELTEDDIGFSIFVTVTATNTQGSTDQNSNTLGPFAESIFHSYSSAYSNAYNQ